MQTSSPYNVILLWALLWTSCVAVGARAQELPLIYADDFERDSHRWEATDPAAWRISSDGEGPDDEGHVFSLFADSQYEPPYRSPLNIARLVGTPVTDFEMTVRVRSTQADYDHRDVSLFWGIQDPSNFYYLHLSKRQDDHANQIFIVDDAPRAKISLTSTPGTDWDSAWHQVKIVRRVGDGTIEAYFDDMSTPVMTALDTTFSWGEVGLGSFDDTVDFDDFRLYGTLVPEPGSSVWLMPLCCLLLASARSLVRSRTH